MKKEKMKRKLSENECDLLNITLVDDGYELIIRPSFKIKQYTSKEAEEETQRFFDIIKEIDYDGFVISEMSIRNKLFYIMLIPISMNEMIDFIWTYFEDYGMKDRPDEDKLRYGTCVLEKIIELIPLDADPKYKKEAEENCEKIINCIF